MDHTAAAPRRAPAPGGAPSPRRVRFTWLVCALGLFVAWIVLHLPITDAMTGLLNRLGFAAYDRLLSSLAVVMGAAAMATILWREKWSATPVVRTAVFLLLFVALAQMLLIISPVEYVHYPQYALVAYLLGRSGVPLEVAWLAATGLGALDEGFQWGLLRRGRPEYFDWNDVVLNAIGAAWGVVLLCAGGRVGAGRSFGNRFVFMAAVASILAAALAEPPIWSPYPTMSPRGSAFRILSAAEALVLVGLVSGLVRGLLSRLSSGGTSRSMTRQLGEATR
ncbi:MAG: hypothetical protein ACT4QD_04050 [Acidobacteriota bacterium]